MEIETILKPPSTDLRGILLSVRTQIPDGPEYEKKYHLYINVQGEVIPTHRQIVCGQIGSSCGPPVKDSFYVTMREILCCLS